MTNRHFKQVFQKIVFIISVCLFPIAAINATGKKINEKRIGVAMRMIGHEVLMCLGDSESRILPIEKIDNHYKIPFEFEFGFDPDNIVSIVAQVMAETEIATDYLVEVEQCETNEVVYSYFTNPSVIPCRGRILPKDCYSLLVTLLDENGIAALSSEHSSLTYSETKNANSSNSAYIIIPLLVLIGFIGFFIKKRNGVDIDPNMVLIGASHFDKKNMALSFENNRVVLSSKETELLSVLHTSANAPVEREVILQRVWGDEGDYVGRTLDVFISKLRKKLEADASVKIINIRGIGYKLVMN